MKRQIQFNFFKTSFFCIILTMVKIVRLKGFRILNDGMRGKVPKSRAQKSITPYGQTKNDPSSNNDRESRAKEYTSQLYIIFIS